MEQKPNYRFSGSILRIYEYDLLCFFFFRFQIKFYNVTLDVVCVFTSLGYRHKQSMPLYLYGFVFKIVLSVKTEKKNYSDSSQNSLNRTCTNRKIWEWKICDANNLKIRKTKRWLSLAPSYHRVSRLYWLYYRTWTSNAKCSEYNISHCVCSHLFPATLKVKINCLNFVSS